MLSPETIERYRRMTPEQRLALSMRAMEENYPALLAGDREVVARRFERLRQEKAARNAAIWRGLAAAEERNGSTD